MEIFISDAVVTDHGVSVINKSTLVGDTLTPYTVKGFT